MRTIQPIDTRAAISVATFREALRAFMRESELVVKANGLTPQRYLLLLMIKGAEDGSERSTVTNLAARLRLAQTSISDQVRRAEEAGLLTREHSEADARVAILRLTPEGESRLARAFHGNATERRRLREMVAQLTD